MTGSSRKPEVIDLTGSDDDLYFPDDDVVLLQTPPRNMRKFNNAEAPIDVDGEEEAGLLQRFTPEENEWRRMLMMDHDVLEEERPKRHGEDITRADEAGEGSKRIRFKQVTFDLPDNTDDTSAVTPDSPEVPTLDTLISQLLAIIPDMCPEHASKELQFLLATRQHTNAIETILTKAFEDGYPKPTKRATIVEIGVEEKYAGKEYRAEKRRGLCYQALSNVALEEAFPFVPVPYIRALQNKHAFLFGPTYLQLVADDLEVVKPFTILKRPRPASKGKNAMPEMDEGGLEFELEKNWILAHAAAMRVKRDAAIAKKLADEAEWAAGGGVECGCCYGDFLPGDMFQCQDGHLFCGECCTRQTETKLGEEVHIILCMDTSGCQARFHEKELARVLPAKSLELLQRLRFAQELEDAAIEGLESCPHCPWAVVIDNPDEKLFRCQNETCGKVSCRQCKQAEHLPKSCEEIAASKKEHKRHAVEDAMSEALIRKCPKCAKPYIKDSGCNKIRCVKCKSVSCYTCQQLIEGYDHFMDHRPPSRTARGPATQCRLWDHEEAKKDAANVLRARDAAVLAQTERAAAEGVVIDAQDLAVEAPGPAPPGPLDHAYARLLRDVAPHRPDPFGHIPPIPPRAPYNPGAFVDMNRANYPGFPEDFFAEIDANPFVPAPDQYPPVPAPNPYPLGHIFNAPPLQIRPMGAHLPFGPYAPDNIRAWMRANPEYNPPLAVAEEAIINDFRREAQQFRELREQRRIQRGPPDIQAERMVAARVAAAAQAEAAAQGAHLEVLRRDIERDDLQQRIMMQARRAARAARDARDARDAERARDQRAMEIDEVDHAV